MSQAATPVGSSVVAVYPDHESAERAVRLLHKEGFAMSDLSIVGRDFQVSEEPVGFVNAGDFAAAGAGTGAWVGGLFGLLVGAAFLILPGLGPVIVAGPLSAACSAASKAPWPARRRRPGRRPGRLGRPQGPGAQVRDPGQGGQVPRRRPRRRPRTSTRAKALLAPGAARARRGLRDVRHGLIEAAAADAQRSGLSTSPLRSLG